MHYIQMHYIQMHYIADAETVEFLKRTRTPEATEAIRSKPATYVHGEDDRAIPLGFGVGCFRDLWPDDPVTTLPGVGRFLQEDAPEAVSALIMQFSQLSSSVK
jgi:pimeloyl-ACP methyl ester carboxylesterase